MVGESCFPLLAQGGGSGVPPLPHQFTHACRSLLCCVVTIVIGASKSVSVTGCVGRLGWRQARFIQRFLEWLSEPAFVLESHVTRRAMAGMLGLASIISCVGSLRRRLPALRPVGSCVGRRCCGLLPRHACSVGSLRWVAHGPRILHRSGACLLRSVAHFSGKCCGGSFRKSNPARRIRCQVGGHRKRVQTHSQSLKSITLWRCVVALSCPCPSGLAS